MTARTIVTTQPDVACDVCARRLLRGEQPEVFIGAGRRLLVCELCAPSAACEGWVRESDSHSLSLPPMRPRRGRSLLDRLSMSLRGRQVAPSARDADEVAEEHVSGSQPLAGVANEPLGAVAPAPNRLRGGEAEHTAMPVRAPDQVALSSAHALETPPERPETSAQPNEYLMQAVTVFNASQLPRRIAGVTRSLGDPSVTVRSAEHLSSVVTIVVAWELCWYRYEVDLSEPVVEAQVIDQGTEVAQLAREDRVANAFAATDGTLSLV